MKVSSKEIRKIVHIDMDAFFASVEERDKPQYKNKPLIIGGFPFSRSVVSTCNYKAREYKIHSGLSSQRASELCPHAIYIKPNIAKYKKVSKEIKKILKKYSNIIQSPSMDEAYLDLTKNTSFNNSASLTAQKILSDIYKQTSLTASAGVSYNKFLAKVASDFQKPYGITVVTPEKAREFISKLKIREFHGIGPVTEAKLKEKGIATGEDLQKTNISKLKSIFGSRAETYLDLANGIDNSPIITESVRKSFGTETTFRFNLKTKRDIYIELYKMLFDIFIYVEKEKIIPKTITTKIKYSNFKTITRSKTKVTGYKDFKDGMYTLQEIIKNLELEREVRLTGVSISNF